ncbi:MAG: hypothetical protein OHK0013_37610 [Sandaracinaceae bacterium]
MIRAAVVVIVLALVGVLGVLLNRIASLEAHELDARGIPVAIADVAARSEAGMDLVSARLELGEDAVFELCSSDRLGDAWGDGGRVALHVGSDVAVDAVLDAATRARARSSTQGACLEIGRGTIQVAGDYVLRARFFGTPPEARVRGRILARRPLGPVERNGVIAVLGLAILLVVVLAMRAPRETSLGWARVARRMPRALRAVAARARRLGHRHPIFFSLGTVVVGAALVVATGVIIPALLPGGSTYGLVAGLLLACAEVALAFVLVRGSADRLGLTRPRVLWTTALFFLAAPVVGFALRGFAVWALSHVEATGEAPIEAFVAWPSGLLSFGTLAVVAPVAEEVFFRGFVFGAVDDGRWGGRRATAFLLAWSLFALAHLQQVWGNWGGLLAVTVAGFVFTTLRVVSGSTLVPALAHLVYNALLSVSVLTAVIAWSSS